MQKNKDNAKHRSKQAKTLVQKAKEASNVEFSEELSKVKLNNTITNSVNNPNTKKTM